MQNEGGYGIEERETRLRQTRHTERNRSAVTAQSLIRTDGNSNVNVKVVNFWNGR